MEILYTDNHFIAVYKPAGIASQGDKTGDECMVDLVREYIRETDNKPGNVFTGLIHRIDRPVSGVLLLARTSKGLTKGNELFRGRAIQKTYWAIVKNQPPKESDTITHFLIKNEKLNTSKAHSSAQKNSLESSLSYTILAKSDSFYLLEVLPHTGRHHQIRAQLSAIGCPIVGDMKYGYQRGNPDKSICLHARGLNFVHPIRKEAINIIAPLPSTMPWTFFEDKIFSIK